MRPRSHPRSLSALLALPLLVLPGAAFSVRSGDLAQRLAAVEKQLDIESKSWLEALKGASTDAERKDVLAAFPRDEFVPELSAIAKEGGTTDVAAKAWLQLVRIGQWVEDKDLHAQAVEHLLADHVTSGRMGTLISLLLYGSPQWTAPSAADALRRIMAANPDPGMQQECVAELALLLGTDESFGEAGRKEAETLLARIEKEFGSTEFNAMDGKQFAAGARNEIQALRVGQVAPDFEVTDQEGARFKLSDYRGRVVVLDFWGFV